MTTLLKKDWEVVKITKKTFTTPVQSLQPYMIASKNNTGYRIGILLVIKKY